MGMGPSNPGLEPSDHPMDIREDLDGPRAIPEHGLGEGEAFRNRAIEAQTICADRGIMAELVVEKTKCSLG